MTTDPFEHEEFRDWDAAYVTGLLRPEERRAYERHLAGCAECSRAVAELAGMPAVLGRLTPDEAVALLEDEPAAVVARKPGSVQDLARTAARRRSRARRRIAGAIVGSGVALAGLGVLTGVWIGQLGTAQEIAGGVPASAPGPVASGAVTPGPQRLAMSQVEPGYIDAELRVTPADWGTRFDWDCSYSEKLQSTLDGPVPYDLVVTDRGGVETTVASWTAENGSGAGDLSASTSIPADEIASVDIRISGSDQPIVRTEL